MQHSVLQAGSTVAGFDVVSVKELEEYGSSSVFCRHRATGCEVMHLVNDDPENLFAFAFRTPPGDDTGVSHILEHSVLCGSRDFPLKDPFVVLLKTSLQTFLNAFTFPDKTVYPASSMVEKDYFNLLRVYGDAVFFPLLREEVFMQEGHHLELAADPPQLRRVGVVFNEMKGVFSSVEAVVGDFSMRSLFPDTPYGLESGGDPLAIPSLSHRDLVEFHRRFYHPSNCRVFLYGNTPTDRILGFLSEQFLRSFERAETPSEIPLQQRWDSPRRFERTVAADGRGGTDRRSTVTLSWLTAPVSDSLTLLALEVLSELLVGNVGAPLHRRLLESGLGEDLSPATGLDTELNEAVFTVGLRGCDPASAVAIEELAISAIRGLARDGIPAEQIEGAVNRVEFRNREIRRGGRPYSLTLMRRALRGWLHGSEPETTLEFRPWMAVLKQKLAEGRYLEGLLCRHFLENPHRSTLTVRPDPQQGEREEQEEQGALKALLEGMGSAERSATAQAEERLRAFQELDDRSEDRARVPALRLSDLKKEVDLIPGERILGQLPVPVLHHDLFTNGVVYVDLVFDTAGLPRELFDLLPMLGKATHGTGLPGIPYHVVAGRLSRLTGGFGAVLAADSMAAPAEGIRQHLIFRLKMLEEKLPEALELAGQLIREADFRDLDRLGKIVLEMRNDMKGSLVPGGNFYASLRAGSRLSPALAVEERWQGITQYLLLDELGRDLEGKLASLAASLELLRGAVVNRRRLMINLTCPEGALGSLGPELEKFVAEVSEDRPPGVADGPFPGLPEPVEVSAERRPEALVSSTNVGFVARSVPASPFGSPESAHEAVLAHFLTTGYLWEKVRMKGGAYGAGASASGLERVFSFSSYRDPHLRQTLDSFEQGLRFAAQQRLAGEEFEQILLGTAGKEDRPMAPGEKGFVALKRELLGIDDRSRQKRRDAMVSAGPEDLSAAALRILESSDGGCTVVLCGSRALDREAEGLGELAGNRLELPE